MHIHIYIYIYIYKPTNNNTSKQTYQQTNNKPKQQTDQQTTIHGFKRQHAHQTQVRKMGHG